MVKHCGWFAPILWGLTYINGHFRYLNWKYLPYIRLLQGLCKGIYPPKKAGWMTRPSLDRFRGHRSERLPHGRWLPYRPKGVVRSNAWGLLLKFRSITTGQGDGGMEEKPGLSDHTVMKTPHCYSWSTLLKFIMSVSSHTKPHGTRWNPEHFPGNSRLKPQQSSTHP